MGRKSITDLTGKATIKQDVFARLREEVPELVEGRHGWTLLEDDGEYLYLRGLGGATVVTDRDALEDYQGDGDVEALGPGAVMQFATIAGATLARQKDAAEKLGLDSVLEAVESTIRGLAWVYYKEVQIDRVATGSAFFASRFIVDEETQYIVVREALEFACDRTARREAEGRQCTS